MSITMQIARGSREVLERRVEDTGLGALPPAFTRMAAANRARFAAVSPAQLAQLEAALRAVPQIGARAPLVLDMLRQGVPNSPAPNATDAPTEAAPETIDLHKSWHVLHFLFSGRADEGGTPPANFLATGGREIGDDDGYGPARLLDSRQTAAFSAFLDGLTVETLTARVDGPRMAGLGIYCAGDGGAAEIAEMVEDVRFYFPQLQSHFRRAREAGESTLISLT